MAVIAADDFAAYPGTIWTTTDTGTNFSIVNGRLYADGGIGSPVWSDPARRITASTARSGVGGFATIFRLTNRGGIGPGIGLQSVTNPTNPSSNGSGLVFDYPDLKVYSDASNPALVNPLGLRMRSIDYVFTVLARATSGYLVAISVPVGSAGGPYATFPSATLLWVEDTGSGTPLYAHLASHSGYWYAKRAAWLDNTELSAALQTRYGAALGADDFTASNGTTLSGRTTPTGSKTWTLTGTATVQSNQAQMSTGAVALFNATTVPRTIQAFVTRNTSSSSRAVLCFRGDGTYAGSWKFKGEFDRISIHNTSGLVDQTGAIALTQDVEYHLRVVDYGSVIECYVNGIRYFQVSSTAQNTNTWVGIASDTGSAQVTINDFAAYPPTITLPTTFGPVPAVPAPIGSALQSYAFTAANGTALPTYNAAFTIRSGTWNIQSNTARMTTSGVNGVATVATGAAGVNHQIRADITMPSTTPLYPIDWFPAVFCRYTDANNFVMARFLIQHDGVNGSNEVEVWENNATTETLIGYINLGVNILAPSSTHNLRLAVNGAEVSAWYDGETVVQATTSVLTGSNAGIGVRDTLPNGQPSWDNVEVWATSSADTTGPVISAQSAGTPGSATATITFTTDELADSRVEYGLNTSYGSSSGTLDTSPRVTSHSVPLSGLSPSTTYHYQIISTDASSNTTTDTDRTFTTAAAGAAVISSVTITSVTQTTMTVTCVTDVPATVRGEYGTTVGYGTNTGESTLGTSHSRTLSPLSASTLYHYRLRASTPTTSVTSDATFTTLSSVASARTLPVYLIDVAWSRARTGAITIGTSTIGGSDQIGGLFSHYTFNSIKNDVKDLVYQRGRIGQDGFMNAGTMSVLLKDLTGTYNPENTGSSLSPNVVPLRPIRVRATHNSITYGCFFGFITRIEHNPSKNARETRIEAIDFFYWLDACKPVISLGETTVGAAIGALLSAAGLTDPAYIALDTGHRIPFLIGDGTKSALQLIQELLTVDMGVLFVDGDGKVTYHDTNRRYSPGTVDDTFTTAMIGDARPSTDIQQVRNGWTVTREGGVPQTVYDATTRDPAYFGARDGDPITSKHLMSDTQAGSLAAFKTLLYKDPTNPVRGVRLANDDDTNIVKQLARDVGDRVALSESLGGTSTTGFIEGASHHVWEAGKFHETQFVISKRRFDFITIGTSTIGSAHLISY